MAAESLELIIKVKKELMGPLEGQYEKIHDRPTDRYVTGFLNPHVSSQEHDSESIQVEEDTLGNASEEKTDIIYQPGVNSIGIYFKTSKPSAFKILVSYGRYSKIKNENAYGRQPFYYIKKINYSGQSLCEKQNIESDENFRLYITIQINSSGYASITLTNEALKKIKYDEQYRYCVFQPSIRIKYVNGEIIPEYGGFARDKTIEMQYRGYGELARGENCSAIWKEHDIERINNKSYDYHDSWCDYIDKYNEFYSPHLRTEFMPVYMSKQPESISGTLQFDPEQLSQKEFNPDALQVFVESYGEWIQAVERGDIDDKYAVYRNNNIKNMRNALYRIQNGIEILRKNPLAFRAFQFVNQAVSLNQEWKKRKFFWRPFQLAFLLMEIENIVNENSEDRSKMDILWVYTGAGKTEAYLSVALFDIMWRRYNSTDSSINPGTSVFTRYTLRLLTSQQFRRTVDLITAAEFVRRNYRRFNDGFYYPVSAGMWVGDKVTPNKLSEAVNVITRPDNIPNEQNGSPIQLYRCPGCGNWLAVPENEALEPGTPLYIASSEDLKMKTEKWEIKQIKNTDRKKIYSVSFNTKVNRSEIINSTCYDKLKEYGIYIQAPGYVVNRERGKKSIGIFCYNPECPVFNTEIPAYTVDEIIYKCKPSIIIGTVDKIAGISSNPDASNILGDMHDNNIKPPDLIIQDEMHLLSGPLGSLFGIYENMVNSIIMERNKKTIKYIGASATVSMVKDQASLLFARDAAIFPPPGMSPDENFFFTSSQDSHSVNRGYRFYVGVAPVKSIQTPLINLMTKMIHFGRECDVSDRKYYYTPVFYFNSIKELSIAVSLAREDVAERLHKKYNMVLDPNTWIELSGRVSSAEIPLKLDRMESWKSDRENENPSALFTTSMFGTGVDISRLTSMIMSGQPKSTSEYIQATGRIGRGKDGVVFILYNRTKPRDLSHYEMFLQYHGRINLYVEHSPVSPYARDIVSTGIGPVMTGYLRSVVQDFYKNDSAGDIISYNMIAIDKFKNYIRERLSFIKNYRDNTDIDGIIQSIDQGIERWKNIAGKSSNLLFRTAPLSYLKNKHPDVVLGQPLDITKKAEIVFENAPVSLREVEEESVFRCNTSQDTVKLRKSQFIISYGPGSIIEGNNDSFLIQSKNIFGLPFLNRNTLVQNNIINDGSVLAGRWLSREFNVKSSIKLISPVVSSDNSVYYQTFQFPQWYICNNLRNHKGNRYILYQRIIKPDSPEDNRFINGKCPECKTNDNSSPVRFVTACHSGHMNDVNWHFAVHRSNRCPGKYYYWQAGGYSLNSIKIICPECSMETDMGKVYKLKMDCQGTTSDLTHEDCDQKVKVMQRDSSSLRIPEIIMFLDIKTKTSANPELERLIETAKQYYDNENLFKAALTEIKKIDPRTYELVISDREGFFSGKYYPDPVNESFISEYNYLSSNYNARLKYGICLNGSNGKNQETAIDIMEVPGISAVIVQTGYRRIVSNNANSDGDNGQVTVPSYSIYNKDYYFPSVRITGDAIFLKFTGLKSGSTVSFGARYNGIYEKYINRDSNFVLLHTLSHSLIKVISYYTGYSLPSLRERIYFKGEEGAILIYNVTAGEGGSMGGLSDLISAENIETIFKMARDNIDFCSNDPFCKMENISEDGENGHACYSCLLLPETSCEYGNKFLDRSSIKIEGLHAKIFS